MFVVGAAAALLLALAAVWKSLRAAFGVGELQDLQSTVVSESRRALTAHKSLLLQEIRELEFERDAGKISDADFAALNQKLRRRAKDVLKKLDEGVDAYREQAEAAIEAHVKKAARRTPEPEELPLVSSTCPACTAINAADADFCSSCGARLASITCGKCHNDNDPDATFCKRCGSELSEKPTEEGT